jgi:phosphoserine phosphatase
MKPRLLSAIVATLCLGVACSSPAPGAPGSSNAPATPATAPVPRDALPSWNDGPSKKALTTFVSRVSTDGSPDFVPGNERVAVFDNDGTLWAEQPIYFQLAFALDRVKALAPQHPEWQTREPFKSVLAGDMKGVMAGGEHALLDIIAASHAGNTTAEFEQVVKDWLTTAKHPKTGRLYTEMVYQPMREVLDYLRTNGFKTYIVSGGGVEFMRPWVDRVYGIPPEQVVGSRIKMKYEVRNGVPVIVRLAEIDFVDDKAGKAIGIQQVIGRRPTIALGNSDGDFEMLEWTTTAPGPRLGVIVHHTDAEREWAYDRESSVGRLMRGLDEADRHGWVVVDMKQDWARIFP